MGGSIVATVIGAAVSFYSSAKQAKAQKKSAKAQKNALAAQQRIADQKAARERIRAVRDARVKRGMIAARASGSGVGTASGSQAGQQGVVAQMGSTMAFSQAVQKEGQTASHYNQKAADYQADAMKWGAIGGIGSTIFSNADRIGGMFS